MKPKVAQNCPVTYIHDIATLLELGVRNVFASSRKTQGWLTMQQQPCFAWLQQRLSWSDFHPVTSPDDCALWPLFHLFVMTFTCSQSPRSSQQKWSRHNLSHSLLFLQSVDCVSVCTQLVLLKELSDFFPLNFSFRTLAVSCGLHSSLSVWVDLDLFPSSHVHCVSSCSL